MPTICAVFMLVQTFMTYDRSVLTDCMCRDYVISVFVEMRGMLLANTDCVSCYTEELREWEKQKEGIQHNIINVNMAHQGS